MTIVGIRPPKNAGLGPQNTSAALLQSRLPNCRGLFKLSEDDDLPAAPLQSRAARRLEIVAVTAKRVAPCHQTSSIGRESIHRKTSHPHPKAPPSAGMQNRPRGFGGGLIFVGSMTRTHQFGENTRWGYLAGLDHRTGRFMFKRLARMTVVGIRPWAPVNFGGSAAVMAAQPQRSI